MKLRGLYAVTPEGGDVERKLRLALEGGIALLQYRSKSINRSRAQAVVGLAREFGVPVIVNDDVELALELGADGAHLGRDDGALSIARRRLSGKVLGASCYNDLALAQTLFKRALERDPSSYRAAMGVASVFVLQRDFDSASRAFDATRSRTHDKDEQKFLTAAIGDLATIKVR